MLYILLGENRYLRQQSLGAIKKELGLAEGDATVFPGAQVTPAELANAVNTIPFLSPNRLVLVEGLLGRFEPRKGAGDAAPKGLISEFTTAARPAIPTTTLVLIEDVVSEQNPLFKMLAPSASVKSFYPLRGQDLRGWIRDEVANRGGSITPTAIGVLVNLAGDDLCSLSNEIDKLLLYSDGQTVQDAHVREIVTSTGETNVFHLVDALLQRRLAVASRQMHELMFHGMVPTHLVGLVARQLRFLVLAKELQAQKVSDADIQRRVGLRDFELRRTLAQASEYSFSQLVQAYELLLDADIAIKTGRQTDQLAMDVLVAEIGRNKG